jgi:gamma-butyrobetaine dioxygenase
MMIRSSRFQIAYRLKAGEMAVFDNRRVLHGRQSFNPNTGLRHLRGCYVDRGEFQSRIRVLSR